jgi:4-diphosphocytidyl-2-C-methyl-D-erythritol kinase
MAAIVEPARAKINLTLLVRGRRDDGYHDLDSLVAFADRGDRLTLDAGPALALELVGARSQSCGALGDNLVLKAARLLGETVPGLTLGRFTLDKRLPVAAGIGGGSADAAATLRLLARANGLKLDDPRLIAAARETGADVPVCLASRSCIMRGLGERLEPVALPRMVCVLVNPDVTLSTREVFAALGLEPGELRSTATPGDWPGERASPDDWCAAIARGRNDLQPAAMRLRPVIGVVIEALERTAGCKVARMSGSGATCFGLFADAGYAARAVRRLRREHPDWWIWAGGVG